jgi:sulfite reductase beta subunit-like hemoprotein
VRVHIEFNDKRAGTAPMRVRAEMDPVPRKNETIEVEGVLYVVVGVRHVLDGVGRRSDARHASVNVVCKALGDEQVPVPVSEGLPEDYWETAG